MTGICFTNRLQFQVNKQVLVPALEWKFSNIPSHAGRQCSGWVLVSSFVSLFCGGGLSKLSRSSIVVEVLLLSSSFIRSKADEERRAEKWNFICLGSRNCKMCCWRRVMWAPRAQKIFGRLNSGCIVKKRISETLKPVSLCRYFLPLHGGEWWLVCLSTDYSMCCYKGAQFYCCHCYAGAEWGNTNISKVENYLVEKWKL